MRGNPVLPHQLEAVRRFFLSRAADFGLDGTRLDVKYVLNWGGFVNTSFRVSDRRGGLHVKLSTTDEGQEALRRWHALDLATLAGPAS